MVETTSQAAPSVAAPAAGGYVAYRAPKAGGSLALLRPGNWEVREIPGKEGWELFLMGPVGRAETCSVSMTVYVKHAVGTTARQNAEAMLALYRQGREYREVGRAEGLVAGVPAVEAEIAFTLHLPLDSLDAQPTTIRQRHVFLRRGDRLYELTYAAAEEDYDEWLGAFATLVRTLSFPEKPAKGGFRPLLAPTMASKAER